MRDRTDVNVGSLFVGVLLITICLGAPHPSSATGFGVYFDFIHAEGQIDRDNFGSEDVDFDADKYGLGFALDTSVARNRLFNYRLNLGYQRTNRHFDDFVLGGTVIDLGHLEADGFNINNTFGFGIWRGPHHRLWLGPTIRLAVDVYDTNDSDIDIVDFSAGGGVSLGLNIHAGPVVSIGLTAGYQYLAVEEWVQVDTNNFFDDTRNSDGHEHLVTANVTLFFRTRGDRFR